ncbi:hypothetical protein HID58_067858 [Brassica napus]|uniref:Uncharacterized protein n=1 Tax=Brassica napus TaxID=3708 RepID=A0ABQ7ZJT3_BRANA|nr:hypothetical protein HID58_067858 [Brassica napus]
MKRISLLLYFTTQSLSTQSLYFRFTVVELGLTLVLIVFSVVVLEAWRRRHSNVSVDTVTTTLEGPTSLKQPISYQKAGRYFSLCSGSDLCPGKILPSSRFPFSFILTTEDGFSYCSFQAVGYDFNTIQLGVAVNAYQPEISVYLEDYGCRESGPVNSDVSYD